MAVGPHAELRRALIEAVHIVVDALEADARRAVENPDAKKLPRRKPQNPINRRPPPPPTRTLEDFTPEERERMERIIRKSEG